MEAVFSGVCIMGCLKRYIPSLAIVEVPRVRIPLGASRGALAQAAKP